MTMFRQRPRPAGELLADTSGASAIEFAFLATVLVAMLFGAVDFIDEHTRRREVDRIAVEVAEAIGECPDSDCVRQSIQALITRRDVLLGGLPGGSLGAAEVTRVGDSLILLQGSMTYLPDDLKREALAVLEPQDVGVAVLLEFRYEPFFGLAFDEPRTIRRYAVSLRAKDLRLV